MIVRFELQATKNYKTIRQWAGPRGRQAQRAHQLMREAGFAADFQGPCGREQWAAIYDSLLPRYQLRIFGHAQADSIIFPSKAKLLTDLKAIRDRGEPQPIPLYVYLCDDHFKVSKLCLWGFSVCVR